MGRRRTLVLVAVVLVGVVGGSVVLGLLGAPTVESVDNRFTGVSTNTTTVETGLTVSNPNPDGIRVGETAVDYTVLLNDVPIATGARDGLGLDRGNTTLVFRTAMRNRLIPEWWVSHVRNDETTDVTIDANVTTSLAGGRSVSLSQDRTVETDIIGQFNSAETRPVNASSPVVSDPALYINETRGSWDRANVTDARTPLDIEFDVYNPKPYPYAVSRIGYTVAMNDITVGEGATERGYVIGPGETQTVGVDTAIRNEHIDEWWVSHLERNQVTDLRIDFYLVVEAAGERFTVNLDSIDYRRTIETDIFDNKAAYPTGQDDRNGDDGAGTSTPTPTAGDDDSTETATSESDGDSTGGMLSDGETATEETDTDTPTDEPEGPTTETETDSETDDGILTGTL